MKGIKEIEKKIEELTQELKTSTNLLLRDPHNRDYQFDVDYIRRHINQLKWVLNS